MSKMQGRGGWRVALLVRRAMYSVQRDLTGMGTESHQRRRLQPDERQAAVPETACGMRTSFALVLFPLLLPFLAAAPAWATPTRFPAPFLPRILASELTTFSGLAGAVRRLAKIYRASGDWLVSWTPARPSLRATTEPAHRLDSRPPVSCRASAVL